MSASHVAFGSTRVMATCAHNGQAVAMAAKLCKEKGLLPSDLADRDQIKELQELLIQSGQYIPKTKLESYNTLLNEVEIEVSSEFELNSLPFDGPWKSLEFSMGQLFPVEESQRLSIEIQVRSKKDSILKSYK